MPFFIETFDKPGHAQMRLDKRDEHLAFLERHKRLLLACGAKLTDDGENSGGGVYIVDVQTREEAERFIAHDPFTLAGLFEHVNIVRWRKAYVNGICFL
ncbi:YciI family protein [Paraburkholderia kirstenboschensis]|uniref:YciI family protein n=1 Tax=Paraburkholderia kirstenboschensis TaxID=1245436 RepID=A0ABZ0EBS9_9BURK|nr:YciI family protein [Paraburkholderia kirstenboschensis]WOD14400.1 YciI family protein [Paraburkholderia kirstenboschensis]